VAETAQSGAESSLSIAVWAKLLAWLFQQWSDEYIRGLKYSFPVCLWISQKFDVLSRLAGVSA
jgi:hypothetical protein